MAEDVKKLIEQSKDKTMVIGPGRRRSAVKKLGQIGTAEVVIPLVQALEDEDKEVKMNAFNALSDLTNSSAHEVLRNYYLKTKKKALWQIIRKKNFYPDDLAAKLEFLVKVKAFDEIKNFVDPGNFESILDIVLESQMDNPVEVLEQITDRGGDDVSMKVIKKFVASKNEVLFRLIDRKEWYPPELDKKIMFLLKTERYDKVTEMLDGADFLGILNILIDPKFPMKTQAGECLSHIDNPIIIDEICQLYIKDDLKHLAPMIMKNNWCPNHPRDRIFFYLSTDFLKGFFMSAKLDPQLIGGYLDVPHVRKSIKDHELIPFADFLKETAQALSEGNKPEINADSPLVDMRRRVNEYMEHPKGNQTIREICDDFIETKSPFLGYLIVQMGWAPENPEDAVQFYLSSGQNDKLIKLVDKAVRPLYEIFRGTDERLSKKAREVISNYKNPKTIEEVFRVYFETFDEELAAIIREKEWKPGDKSKKAVFFIFSGQPEKYAEIEPDGHKIIFEAYREMNSVQRYRLIEILIEHKAEKLVPFMLELLTFEKNPRILRLLCNILPVFFGQVYEPLKELIKTTEGPVVHEIITTLVELNTEGSMEMLYDIAKSKTGYMCFWILKLLEDARWQPANNSERAFYYELFKLRDEMMRMLNNDIVDEDPGIREQSAYLFTEMGDEKQVTTLMKYVEDPVDKVRAALAYSIGKLCALAPKNALAQIDSFRIGSIFMIFNDVRKAFIVQNDLEQIQILGRNYQVGNMVLRIFSIAAIEGLRKREGLSTLLLALQDTDPLVKQTAIRALRDLADREAEKPLLALIEDDDKTTRLLVAEALANVAGPETEEQLLKRINSGEYSHADSLIYALAKLDPAAHRELFERIIARPDFSYEGKKSAVLGLGMIKDEKITHTLIANLRSTLMTSLKDDDIVPYIQALGHIGHPGAYEEFAKLMTQANWRIRSEIIRAMGNIPERIAIVSIIKALDDASGWVQMAAVEAFNHYFNLHFKFMGTEKDLKFVASMIAYLKRFRLTQIADKRFAEYEILTNLTVLSLKYRLTMLYFQEKPKIMGEDKK
ncbi:MAG: HEAT repeat domain-containing protein [Firmicutes bacterium]|nr:HEAT repeat domain-containing protein [Bacillota bacterium]